MSLRPIIAAGDCVAVLRLYEYCGVLFGRHYWHEPTAGPMGWHNHRLNTSDPFGAPAHKKIKSLVWAYRQASVLTWLIKFLLIDRSRFLIFLGICKISP
jgi:hypothetical protein